ncbi:MAG: hypothetical protein J5714_02860 [Alphaproteobacteria bacterium]|nr:hypothetical protein [Alphaproteobacteria bacterium]
MRKDITFGLICFAMMFGMAGGALAALGTGEISMGTFSIPLPADGKDGCAPLIRSIDSSVDSSIADGCYVIQQKQQTRNGDSCEGTGSWENITTVCDGDDGAGLGEEDIVVAYVAYPDSTESYTMPYQQGYMTKSVGNTVLNKSEDYCEEFYEDGVTKKKCTAQGDATNWLNSDGTGNYQTGETYVFATDQLNDGYPRNEYTTPRLSGGSSGYPTAPGVTNRVYRYTSGRERFELVAIDACDWYAKRTDTTDRVRKCTVGAPTGTPGLANPYTAGATYCLGDHQSNCSQYTVLVGAVDTCATLSSSDTAWWTTVDHTESEYTDPNYSSSCTTNCTGTPGYKIIKEVMCDGTAHETTQNDTCSPAQSTSVTCASGYIWQTCTKRTAVADTAHGTYSGCFPDPFNDLYARRTDIIPANFAADSNYLYYCRRSDCDTNAACWVDGQINVTPLWNSTNGCWGRVSINGLQGDAGPGCSFVYNGTKWQVCCLPVGANGVIDTTQSWSCNDVDANTEAQLNQWLCKPTYTTFYLTPKAGGGYNETATSSTRPNDTVGIRTRITNCDGTQGATIDTFDGEDGEPGGDYNPCDGLEPGSVAAQTTIQSQTSVYVSNTSSSNIFTPKVGYYQTTTNMCEGNPQITYKQDKCIPVSLATGDSRTVGTITCAANQTLMRCTPQAGASTDPYFICENAEVSGYPEKQYVAPAGTNGVLNTAGYTRWAHKYTSSSSIVYEKIDDDTCRNAVKRTRNAANTQTTTRNVLKCTVQNPGTNGYTEGSSYCLFMASGENCDDYIIAGSEVEEYETKYMSPTGSDGVLTKEGYTCKQRKLTRTAAGSTDPVVVEESCQLVEKDTCNKAVKYTRTTSNQVVNMVEKSLLKCEVQYPGNSSYTAGTYYCLNLGGGENCADYNIVGDVSEQSQDEYVAPTMSDGKPTSVGYLRTSVTNTRFASGSQTYYTNERKDPGRKVYKGTSSTIKYTVQAPGAGSEPFITGAEYCLNMTIGECQTYKDDDPCASVATASDAVKAKTVQKILERTYSPANNSQGSMVSTYKMCDDSTHTESTPDECREVPTPAGQTCTNGVWMQCTRQADEGTGTSTARGTTYGYCAVYPQCVGNESSTSIVKKTQRSYTPPTKTGSNSYYDTVGKITDVKIACDNSSTTIESVDDECDEIPNTTSICPADKVLKQCKRQGKQDSDLAGSTYNLCTVYPQCVGNTSSATIVKKTERSYTAPGGSGGSGDKTYYTTVGKVTDVKVACNGTTISTEESAEDQCDEIPNTASVCPTNKVLKTCTRKGNQGTSNDTKAGTTYNLCTTGPSIYGSIADNDPCGGDTTSDSAKKKVKSIQYEYITKDATGNTAKVGYSKKTTTMCNQAGNTDEYIYDTCIPVASASGCNGANDKNYKCYNQTKLTSTNASEREYNTCNPSSNVSSVALSNKIDGKLDNDVTFTTGTYDNKDYILMSATGITNKPVVPVDTLKPQSLFDTWKEEQKNKNWTAAECAALFGSGVNCSTGAGLTTEMMFQSFTDYGVWKQEQVEDGETDAADLTTTVYRQSLSSCPGGITLTPNGTDANGGNKYTMTCADAS